MDNGQWTVDNGAAKSAGMNFPADGKWSESRFRSAEHRGIREISVIRPQAWAGGRFFAFPNPGA
jgi:hypothetical protein